MKLENINVQMPEQYKICVTAVPCFFWCIVIFIIKVSTAMNNILQICQKKLNFININLISNSFQNFEASAFFI